MKRAIDHIVYCVLDLDEAVDNIEREFGVRPVFGGRHLTKGTKNALLNLGNKCYLEILAIDHENEDIKGARWMGIDLIQEPKITRWSLKSDRLNEDSQILSGFSTELGIIEGASRHTSDGSLLKWQMILPTAHPEIEVLPFMTDWANSESHPTDILEDQCYLRKIALHHPNPSRVRPILSDLGLDIDVLKSDFTQITIDIQTPNGPKCL